MAWSCIVRWIAVTLVVGACTGSNDSEAANEPSLSAAVTSTQFGARTEASAAVPQPLGATFGNPGDAAIGAAMTQDPDVENPQVSRIVGIFADERSVDLRIQVTAPGYCRWYGVGGQVVDGKLEWSAGGGLPCDE